MQQYLKKIMLNSDLLARYRSATLILTLQVQAKSKYDFQVKGDNYGMFESLVSAKPCFQRKP
jgi:hypothetical protein